MKIIQAVGFGCIQFDLDSRLEFDAVILFLFPKGFGGDGCH